MKRYNRVSTFEQDVQITEKDFRVKLTKNNTVLLVGLLASAIGLTAHANPLAKKDLPFDQTSWVTTHNSYEKINQNLKEMPEQLRDGVRGFMLDLYYKQELSAERRVTVCHKELACYGPLSNQLKNEFIPFLKSNPTEVVTILLETYVTKDQLQLTFNAIPELADYSFNPANFSGDRWPTTGEMAKKNNRLILMTDRRDVAGEYLVNGKKIFVLFDQDWLVQNRWDTLGLFASNILSAHNFSCPTRWDGLPLSTGPVQSSTGKKWNRLFLMNQFHHGTSTAPDSGKYDNNLTYLQRRADNCGRQPNFIGVNNYKSGDLFEYANALTQGGVYLWEGNNADKSQDAVCVIPRGSRALSFPSGGCENDEARSLSLSGIDKGTRITLFDSREGSRQDDHTIIDVTRDIGPHERVVVPTFERNASTGSYKQLYNRNNGLDGKVSRVEITQTPVDFSDAAIAFYEGNNGSQNLDCVVPFDRPHNFKMKSNSFGCANDEIRSARVIKAKAGANFTLTGHPEGRFSQGRTTVEVLRDITTPIIIPSFNRSYQDADLKVTRYDQDVDGKISYGYFNGRN